ncbi:MAG: hypothetical protein ACRYFA_13390 [Janthinobacterium lividum]
MNKEKFFQLASEISTTYRNLNLYKSVPLVDHVNIDTVSKGALEIIIETNKTAFKNVVIKIENELKKVLPNLNDINVAENNVIAILSEAANHNLNLQTEQQEVFLKLQEELIDITTTLNKAITSRVRL